MRSLRLYLFATVALAAAGFTNAIAQDTNLDGSINTGSASFFTVLTKGDQGFTDDQLTGGSFVIGNYGVGGQGTLTMSGGSYIQGNLVEHSGGHPSLSGGAKITGTTTTNDAQLNDALVDAQSLSSEAAMESTTPAYASLTSINLMNRSQNFTITGGADQKIVLNLTDFVLNGGATFTLSGTATTSFIINVTNNFSLNGGSKIALSGVPPANVLFNIIGPGAGPGPGNQIALTGGSTMSGTLLALNRKATLSGGSQVIGQVIADQVQLTGGSSVVSPSTNP